MMLTGTSVRGTRGSQPPRGNPAAGGVHRIRLPLIGVAPHHPAPETTWGRQRLTSVETELVSPMHCLRPVSTASLR